MVILITIHINIIFGISYIYIIIMHSLSLTI